MEFSIIVPVFNTDKKFLESCILSLLAQSYFHFEIIIVDDGSTKEETKNMLCSISNMDKRIKMYSISNHGVSYARNYGTTLAKGDYVIYVDSDDEISKDFLQVIHNILVKYPYDLLLSQVTFNKIKLLEEKKSDGVIEKDDIKYKLLNYYLSFYDVDFHNKDEWLNRGPVARVIRTSIAKKNKFDESIRFGEDVLWNIHLLKHVETIVFLKKAFYFYRKNMGSTTVRYHKDFASPLKVLMLKLKDAIKEYWEDEFLRISFSTAAFEYYRIYLKLDLFHPENSISFRKRYVTLKRVSLELIQNTEINKVPYSFFEWKVRIKLFLIRHHFYLLLYFIERR